MAGGIGVFGTEGGTKSINFTKGHGSQFTFQLALVFVMMTGGACGQPMTMKTVQFLFDVGSPNAYLCHKVIPLIEVRTGAKFEYVPILLGGLFKRANNRSPVEAFKDIPHKRAYERLEMDRFIARHSLETPNKN